MRKILLIFRYSALRNKYMIILALLSAVLMSLFFRAMTNSESTAEDYMTIKVGIDDSDGRMTDDIKDYIVNTLKMDVVEGSYDILSKDLIDMQISAIIEVPRGFYDSAVSGSPKKLVITTLGDYENAAFVEAYLGSYMNGLAVISQAANGDGELFDKLLAEREQPLEISSVEAELGADESAAAQQEFNTALGFMISIMSAIAVFIANQILADRALGTYDRMRRTSLKSSEYVIGVSLFGVICCAVMLAAYMCFAYLTHGDMLLPFGTVFGAGLLLAVFSVGLATTMGLCVNSEKALMTVGIGYPVIGSMLGGAWFPIHGSLGFIGGVAKLFPQYWFMDLLRSEAGADVTLNVCILAVSVVLVYLISAVIFTRKSA
ncbi:MAG: ABC transporter permease [Oscillospiraceae bacterium]|nr:ABC transporter permease [Oscillospiraceae bacterium]